MTSLFNRKATAEGEYQKPGPSDLRGPCPAINVLANHGYLPRDGKNITKDILMSALKERYHLSERIALVLATTVLDPDNPLGVRPKGQEKNGEAYINLDQLSIHNKMEHDVSLFHLDTFEGDHTKPQKQMVEALVKESKDGVWVTWMDIARYKAKRYAEVKKKNPQNMLYTVRQMFTSWAEAAVLTLVLGGSVEYPRIPVTYLREFVVEEKFPQGWLPPAKEVSKNDNIWLMVKMFVYSLWF